MSINDAAPVQNKRALSVFLCHSSGDKQAVRELYDRLKSDGFAPWLDEKLLLPGQDWQEKIQVAVKASDVVIVCLSQRSVTKEGYLNREIKDALDAADEKPEGTVFIIPVRLDQVDVPRHLSRWEWADLFTEDGYSRLVAALNIRAGELSLPRTNVLLPVPVISGLSEGPARWSRNAQHSYDRKMLGQRLKAATVVMVMGLLTFLGGVLLERWLGGEHKQINQTQGNLKNFSNDTELNNVAAETGLKAVEYGKYKTEENDRFIANLKNANNVKMLFVNGDNIFQTFKQELRMFLSKPASSMQVLFATPDSDFYREETEMTNLPSNSNDPAYKANQMKMEFNRQRLLGLAVDPAQVQFKYFDTQYRLPVIIIDNKYCYVTLRLSPNESQQSVRLEFEGGTQGFAQSCLAHFNKMWAVSRSSDKKVH